jgi:hypothetical protein
MMQRLFLSAFLLCLWVGSRAAAVQIFSPFYSLNPRGNDRLLNPETPNSFFPDSLQWSVGGDTLFGLQLLIACDRADRTYRVQEPICIRCGLRNCGSQDVFFAYAHYSPNKHGTWGNYTLKIDAPSNVERRPYGWLGDDCLMPPTRNPNQVRIPPGSIFNPSPDHKFYNTWNGIIRLPTAGTYRFWNNLDFDSLCSSIPTGFSNINSDTLVIIVRPLPLVPRLIGGIWGNLQRRWGNFRFKAERRFPVLRSVHHMASDWQNMQRHWRYFWYRARRRPLVPDLIHRVDSFWRNLLRRGRPSRGSGCAATRLSTRSSG